VIVLDDKIFVGNAPAVVAEAAAAIKGRKISGNAR
jgi:hypothetical protein